MAVIKVPKTPRKAFNTKRRPSRLLQDQIAHLEWAVRPASERKPGDFRPKAARTEGSAAARIAELTNRLFAQSARAPGLVAESAPRPAPAARGPAGRRKPRPVKKR
jgi:hypothetical protein